MKKYFLLVVLITTITIYCNAQQEMSAYKQTLKLMGTRFEIIAVFDDEELAMNSIDSAIF